MDSAIIAGGIVFIDREPPPAAVSNQQC